MAGAEAVPHPTPARSSPPSPRTELDRIPGLVSRLRVSFDAGRTRGQTMPDERSMIDRASGFRGGGMLSRRVIM